MTKEGPQLQRVVFAILSRLKDNRKANYLINMKISRPSNGELIKEAISRTLASYKYIGEPPKKQWAGQLRFRIARILPSVEQARLSME